MKKYILLFIILFWFFWYSFGMFDSYISYEDFNWDWTTTRQVYWMWFPWWQYPHPEIAKVVSPWNYDYSIWNKIRLSTNSPSTWIYNSSNTWFNYIYEFSSWGFIYRYDTNSIWYYVQQWTNFYSKRSDFIQWTSSPTSNYSYVPVNLFTNDNYLNIRMFAFDTWFNLSTYDNKAEASIFYFPDHLTYHFCDPSLWNIDWRGRACWSSTFYVPNWYYNRINFFSHGAWSSHIISASLPSSLDWINWGNYDFYSMSSFTASSWETVQPVHLSADALFISPNSYQATKNQYDSRTLVLSKIYNQPWKISATLYWCIVSDIQDFTWFSQQFYSECPIIVNWYLATWNNSALTSYFSLDSNGNLTWITSQQYPLLKTTNWTFSEVSITSNAITFKTPWYTTTNYIVWSSSSDALNNSLIYTDNWSWYQNFSWIFYYPPVDGNTWRMQPISWWIVFTGDPTTAYWFFATTRTCFSWDSEYFKLNFNVANHLSLLKWTFFDFNLIAPLTCNLAWFFQWKNTIFWISNAFTGAYITWIISSVNPSESDKNIFSHLLSLLFALPVIYLAIKTFK